MATSAVPAFIDALFAMVTTAVAPVKVYDGPQVTDSYAKQYVGIGWDSEEPDGSGSSAEVTQAWGPTGARRREEEATINCLVSVWTGDTNAKGRRDAAMVILGQIENAMRTDPTVAATVRIAQMAGGNLNQRQTDGGVRADFVFTVTYVTRI